MDDDDIEFSDYLRGDIAPGAAVLVLALVAAIASIVVGAVWVLHALTT